MPCGWYVEDSRAQAIEHWERIEALGAGRVFAVDAASTFSRPGPRLVDGVELLGHLLHPDLVDPPGNIGFAEVRAPAPRVRPRLDAPSGDGQRADDRDDAERGHRDQLGGEVARGPSMPRSPATIEQGAEQAADEAAEVGRRG